MRKGRDTLLDIQKGIGIIGVVAGHCGVFGHFFYVFHVPLFFFLSGSTLRMMTFTPPHMEMLSSGNHKANKNVISSLCSFTNVISGIAPFIL